MVEFAYNNGYHASTKFHPLKFYMEEVSWNDLVDRLMLGPEILKDLENLVNQVNNRSKEEKCRKKCYDDKFHRDKEY